MNNFQKYYDDAIEISRTVGDTTLIASNKLLMPQITDLLQIN